MYKLPVLSYSSVSTYQTCPRKYRYEYAEARRQPFTTHEIETGTLFHECLEQWTPESCEQALKVAGNNPLVRGMVRAYHADRAPRGLKPLHNEIRFEVTLAGESFKGYIDCIAEMDGRLYAVERKTTGMYLDPYVKMKTLDMQPTLYYAACLQMGLNVDAIILDVMARPRQKKGEKPSEFEERVAATCESRFEVLYKTESDVRAMEEDLDGILAAMKLDKWPRSTGACMKFGSMCTYYGECMNG